MSSVAVSKCHMYNNCMPKRPVIKNKVCDCWMPKLSMVCAGTCVYNLTPFLARPDTMHHAMFILLT